MGILRLQAMTSQKWHAFLFLINRMLWFYTGTSSQPSCNKTDTWHTNAKENWSESLNKRLLRNEEKTEYHSKVCLIHRQKKQNYFKLQINRKKKKITFPAVFVSSSLSVEQPDFFSLSSESSFSGATDLSTFLFASVLSLLESGSMAATSARMLRGEDVVSGL